MGATQHGPFDAAMLEPQGDLKMKDRLPVALEAEVPRFDDSRVHGTHRHLVDFLATHFEEVRDRGQGILIPPPWTGLIGPGQVVAHGLEPGMALGDDPELLGDFTFEEVGLGAFRREGRVSRPSEAGPGDPKALLGIIREDGEEA